jgi:hypothetical protein
MSFTLGLRPRVANERRAQAPILNLRAFGEVDETGERRWLDLGRTDQLLSRNATSASLTALV